VYVLQRDTIIKQHEARITQLEDGLARRIYDEVSQARSGIPHYRCTDHSHSRFLQKAVANKVTP
jgi:hypothetical protein